jgi:Helitron helicase-like domain at N-terminus
MDANSIFIVFCSLTENPPDLDRKQAFKDLFSVSTLDFESRLDSLKHWKCMKCFSVSMRHQEKSIICNNQFICADCRFVKSANDSSVIDLPIWIDENQTVQYYVPEELSGLREGEKLLIQQVSVYVPLQHLSYGQLGARGHIVSFPQNLLSVCKTLPRLPANVDVVQVVKNFKLNDGTISSKSFCIRKSKVLTALYWLKKFNNQYTDIEIREDNLSWITNGDEQQLPIPTWEDPLSQESLSLQENEDLGPSSQQIHEQVLNQGDLIEPCFGISSQFNMNKPKQKDKTVIDALKSAELQGKLLFTESGGSAIEFPYVSSEPVSEYNEPFLMEYAFPWLFPGGTGGFMSGPNPRPGIKDWMKKTMLYMDGRFEQDRLWAFFALNFASRQINQSSGNFYVKGFYENGPKTLDELQAQISAGNLEWLDRITYFSQNVTGSAAYWRARKREVFAWINHHLEKGNGVPTFFITLSCAEYHWADIERLIIDKCRVSGIDLPDFSKGKFTIPVRESHNVKSRNLHSMQISLFFNSNTFIDFCILCKFPLTRMSIFELGHLVFTALLLP